MLTRVAERYLNLVQVLDVPLRDCGNETVEKGRGPLICHHGLLEDFMKQRAIDQRRRGFARRLDAVLEDSTPHTSEAICYHCGRNQLVGVQYKNVLVVVDDALPGWLELAENVHERLGADLGIKPIAPEVDRSRHITPIDSYK